jgi:hypothetical protein
VERRDRQPGSAVVSLQRCDLRRLVRLAVRPEVNARKPDTLGHLLDVRDQCRAVDQERRSLDVVKRRQVVHSADHVAPTGRSDASPLRSSLLRFR